LLRSVEIGSLFVIVAVFDVVSNAIVVLVSFVVVLVVATATTAQCDYYEATAAA